MKVSSKHKPCIYFPSVRFAFRLAVLVLPRTLPSNFFDNLGLQISSLLGFFAEGFTCVYHRSLPAPSPSRPRAGPGGAAGLPLDGLGGRARPDARGPLPPHRWWRQRGPGGAPGGAGGKRLLSSFPRLPARLLPDLPSVLPASPSPNSATRREEPAPSALATPAPRRLARRRRGVPARGTAKAAGCPFTPPSTCSPLLFGNGGGGEARPPLRVVGRGWHGPGPEVTRGSRTFSPSPLSGGRPGAAPLSPLLLGRGIALRGCRSLGGASGCPAGETRVSPLFRGEGEAGAPLPAALLPAPRVARRRLPRRQVATSWSRPPAAGLRPRRETIPRAAGEEEEEKEGAGRAALTRRR